MSNSTVNVSWQAPSFTSFNFTTDVCKEASIWAGITLQQMNRLKLLQDIPVFVTLNYLRKLLPYDWPAPTNSELGAWYLSWANFTDGHPFVMPDVDKVMVAMLNYPLNNCQDTLCKNLEWQGDSDVSGAGMMISYYLAASMSTMYFLIIFVGKLPPVERKTTRNSGLFLFFHSFTDSINTFLDTALIFAAAMLGAAVVRYTSVIRHPERDTSVYSLVGSVYMSAFSIYPAIVLQTVADGLRKLFLRQFLWLVVIVLAIVVEVQYRTTDPWQYDTNTVQGAQAAFVHMREAAWNMACDSDERKLRLINMLTSAHVFLGLNLAWWLYYFLASFVPRGIVARRDNWKAWRIFTRIRPFLRLFAGVVSLTVMWTMLGIFSNYRSEMAARSGSDNKDGSWTFGQVLALATWMPVVIDIAAIYIHGPEIGLSMKLSRTWKVVRSSAKIVLDKKNGSSPYSKLSLSPADTHAFIARSYEERGSNEYDHQESEGGRHTSGTEPRHEARHGPRYEPAQNPRHEEGSESREKRENSN